MKNFDYIRRKFWYSVTRWPGRELRAKALQKLGFQVGKNSYIGPGLTMAIGIADTHMHLAIGDRVSFGPNVTLILATHPNNSRLHHVLKFPPREITIGEDSWLGANSVIMPNVHIGKCCIIGAGAVVTHDVPDYSVVAGVPARVIKTIDPAEIER